MATVDCHLAVVALERDATGLHKVAVEVCEIDLGSGSWYSVKLPCHPKPVHRSTVERFKIHFRTGTVGRLDRVVNSGSGLGGRRLIFLVQGWLLSGGCEFVLVSLSLDSGLIGVLLPLTRCTCGGFRFNLFAGMSDHLQTNLAASQFLWQLTGALALGWSLSAWPSRIQALRSSALVSCSRSFSAWSILS